MRYGPQGWWPAVDPFEIAVGAVLTQGTAWTNAAKGIAALKRAGKLHPGAIDRMAPSGLAERIRPAGFHQVKTRRLKALAAWWLGSGGFRGLRRQPTDELRAGLLQVHGIGRETADAIMLYAFERRVFVVDAYARRLLGRYGLIEGDERYDVLRDLVERRFRGAAADCNEYHALVVAHCKTHCRVRPRCGECCLRARCAYAAARAKPAG